MNISCEHCGKTLKIPDEKVPRGKAFSVPCPSCKKKISVSPEAAASGRKAAVPRSAGAVEAGDTDNENNGQPAGNPELDFLAEGTRTAIICEHDPRLRAISRKAAESMGFVVVESASPRESLKQIRYHAFHLVVINELFGTRDPEMNHVMNYLAQLPMATRRRIFVCAVTERFRSGDKMQAFNRSVNVLINLEDMNDFGKILNQAILDNENFYRTYLEEFKRLKGL
ncbi:MAG: hypothetical protein CSB33_01225 [Desulfobacterales bacterium]|nr:MAG: hypothetical protein CSB33_01225 [Desulfobacterales bacterium]